MRLLTLNCQRGYRLQQLQAFFRKSLRKYDFILLQEVSTPVYRLLDAALKDLPYHVVTHYHDAMHMRSESCIIAKDAYRLLDTSFVSFQHMAGFSGEVGALIAAYDVDGRRVLLSSAHFHSHRYVQARKEEVRLIKRELLARKADVRILAGDFNTMFFGENWWTRRIMAPEFSECAYEAHSHDTILLEETHDAPRRMVAAAKAGLRFKTQLDHFYINPPRKVDAYVLENAGSDHYPVEIELEETGKNEK